MTIFRSFCSLGSYEVEVNIHKIHRKVQHIIWTLHLTLKPPAVCLALGTDGSSWWIKGQVTNLCKTTSGVSQKSRHTPLSPLSTVLLAPTPAIKQFRIQLAIKPYYQHTQLIVVLEQWDITSLAWCMKTMNIIGSEIQSPKATETRPLACGLDVLLRVEFFSHLSQVRWLQTPLCFSGGISNMKLK